MPLPIMAPLAAAAIPGKGAGTVASAMAPALGSMLLMGGQGQQGMAPGPMALPTGMPPGLMGPDMSAAEMLPTEPISPMLMGDPSMLLGGDPLLMGDPAMLRGGDPLLMGDPMQLLERRRQRPSSASVLMRMLLQ